MKLLLAIGLAFAFGCATTPSPALRVAQNDTKETKCRLIGSQLNYDVHNPVRDETKAPGPTRVIWLNPPDTTIIRTEDGLFYRCDGTL
jgi:hypothetical protein